MIDFFFIIILNEENVNPIVLKFYKISNFFTQHMLKRI